jgi:hypothetical protein
MNENAKFWHVTQYANGELVAHNVYTDWDYARLQIHRKGLLSGTCVLARPSQCECRGKQT